MTPTIKAEQQPISFVAGRAAQEPHAAKRLGALQTFWQGWKRVAKIIGDFQARILLTVFYFFIFGPFALAVRLFRDPLGIKPGGARGWHAKGDEAIAPMERATRQF